MAVVSNLIVNGTLVQEVVVGTKVIDKVICNGVVVYEKTTTPPTPVAGDDEIIAAIRSGKLFTSFVYRNPDDNELSLIVYVFVDMKISYDDWVAKYGEEIANVIKQFLCLVAQKQGDEDKLNEINSAIINMINDGTLEQYVQTLVEYISEGYDSGVSFDNMMDYLYGREDALAIRSNILEYIADQIGITVEDLKEGNW